MNKLTAEMKNAAPPQLIQLNNTLTGLRDSAKLAAQEFGTATPEQLPERQKEAEQHCRTAMQLFTQITGPLTEDKNYLSAKNAFRRMEAKTGSNVIKKSGQTMSAAKWIDAFKAKIPKKGPVDADTVALIFASRRLSQAVFGKRGNIDRTKLSEQQIRQQAEPLKDSPEFQKFMKAPTFKLMTMNKDTVDTLCKGDEEAFRAEFEDFNRACRNLFNTYSGKFEPKGSIQPSPDQLKAASEQDPALNKIVDGYTDLRKSTLKEDGTTEQKVAKVINDIVEYQNKNAAAKGSTADAVNDTMRLLNVAVRGTCLENHILDQQISKVNEARGLTPGKDGFISRDSLAMVSQESLAKDTAQSKPGEVKQEVNPL